MSKAMRALALFAIVAAGSGCSDDDTTKNDQGIPVDNGVVDEGTVDGPLVDPDGGTPVDTIPSDAAPNFTRELPLGHDDGLPAVRLRSFPLAKSHTRFYSMGSDPMQIRKLRLIPLTAWSGVVSVHADQGGLPGNKLGEKTISFVQGDVEQWTEVDLSDQNILVTGTFWITIEFDSSLSDSQETMIGSTYSSGNSLFWRAAYGTITVNFEPIFRLVVGVTDNAPSVEPPAGPGTGCSSALDCQSGYCAGGKCTVECPNDTCDANQSCRDMELGKKICVYTCADNTSCPDQAFCLTDTRIIDPAGFCVLDGAADDGADCQYQYHTFCKSGRCSSCDDDTECSVAGTCLAN